MQLMESGELCRGLDTFTLDWDALLQMTEQKGAIVLDSLARTSIDIPLRALYAVNARQLPIWSGGLDILTDDLTDLLRQNMACVVLAGPEEKNAKALVGDLVKRGIPALYAPSPQAPIARLKASCPNFPVLPSCAV